MEKFIKRNVNNKLTKKEKEHLDRCNAPICKFNQDEKALWYPGEKVCIHKPFEEFQKIQIQLNELFRKKKIKEEPLTIKEIKRIGREIVDSKTL